MCGFSAGVVQVLTQLDVKYQAYNVLDDMDLREGIKTYSDWPTIPQLYVQGEFIGGFDIVREMAESGELQTLLKEKGLAEA
jgi:monothiol glutaredoxin